MARIRSLHATQWNDDDFLECSPLARLLALALRNFADDSGVFEWKPKQIKRTCLPADACDVAPLLRELVDHRQVCQFSVDGREYGAIRNFRTWQRPKSPNSLYPLTDEIRIYVAIIKRNFGNGTSSDDENSEIEDAEQVANSENSRADVGCRRKDVGDKREEVGSSAPQADAATPSPPSVEPPKKRKVNTTLPDGFPFQANLDEALKHWGAVSRPDLSALAEYDKFRAHHESRGSRMVDWSAAWRTWFHNAPTFTKPPAPTFSRPGAIREFTPEENAIIEGRAPRRPN